MCLYVDGEWERGMGGDYFIWGAIRRGTARKKGVFTLCEGVVKGIGEGEWGWGGEGVAQIGEKQAYVLL